MKCSSEYKLSKRLSILAASVWYLVCLAFPLSVYFKCVATVYYHCLDLLVSCLPSLPCEVQFSVAGDSCLVCIHSYLPAD